MTTTRFTKNTTQPPFSAYSVNDYRAVVNGYTLRVVKTTRGWTAQALHGYELRHKAFEVVATRKQAEKELLAWVESKTAPIDNDGIDMIRTKLLSVLSGNDTLIEADPTLTAIRALLDDTSSTEMTVYNSVTTEEAIHATLARKSDVYRREVSAQATHDLAALIRKVDGNHQLGAAALAEALVAEGVIVSAAREPETPMPSPPAQVPPPLYVPPHPAQVPPPAQGPEMSHPGASGHTVIPSRADRAVRAYRDGIAARQRDWSDPDFDWRGMANTLLNVVADLPEVRADIARQWNMAADALEQSTAQSDSEDAT